MIYESAILFGLSSGTALATVVGVRIDLPGMARLVTMRLKTES